MTGRVIAMLESIRKMVPPAKRKAIKDFYMTDEDGLYVFLEEGWTTDFAKSGSPDVVWSGETHFGPAMDEIAEKLKTLHRIE